MNKRILYASLPIAALFCTGANAQTWMNEPALSPLMTPSEQTTVYRTITRPPVVAQTEPRKVLRKQVKQTIGKNGKIVRTTTTERVVTRPAPVVRERIVTRQPATTTYVSADPVDLTQDQRTIVYRTLVQQPIQPAPVVTERYLTSPVARPYVTTEPVVTAPQYEQRVITVPSTTGSGYGYVTDAPGGYVPSTEIVIGSRIPASVPLYAMPAETIAAVPSMAAYRYALIGNRVYLVDPRDGIVSAMLYQ